MEKLTFLTSVVTAVTWPSGTAMELAIIVKIATAVVRMRLCPVLELRAVLSKAAMHQMEKNSL